MQEKCILKNVCGVSSNLLLLGREGVAALKVGDLIKEESDTLKFSYWREVENLVYGLHING